MTPLSEIEKNASEAGTAADGRDWEAWIDLLHASFHETIPGLTFHLVDFAGVPALGLRYQGAARSGYRVLELAGLTYNDVRRHAKELVEGLS